jgi:hypothetical protein
LRVVLTAPDGSNPFSLFSRLAYNSLKTNTMLNNTNFFWQMQDKYIAIQKTKIIQGSVYL